MKFLISDFGSGSKSALVNESASEWVTRYVSGTEVEYRGGESVLQAKGISATVTGH
jgi:hypothetical protein